MKQVTGPMAMKAALMMAAASAVTIGAAVAQTKTTCARGGDSRIIEVVTPGTVGASCDVRYTRSADNVSTPYHADTSESFCVEKARVLVNNLTQAGFECGSAESGLRTEPAPQTDYVVEARRPAAPVAEAPAPATNTVTEIVPEAPAEPVVQPAPPVEPAGEEEVEPQAAAPAGYGATDEAFLDTPQGATPVTMASAPAEDAALAASMNEILEQPAAQKIANEPAQLVAQQADVAGARPQPTPVGRLVGAAPDTTRSTISATPASFQEPAPAAETPAPSVATKQEEKAPTADASALRSPRDVIRATLMAQAAAWNEGNLDAFMAGYWKSDELKLVSGGEVTKGWSSVMRYYRDKYGDDAEFGQLSFDKLDAKMITDNVAVVTGRFALVQNTQTQSGSFSLVMRRDNGAWRIVHDHTNADPVAAE